jgi:hypothetical protein
MFDYLCHSKPLNKFKFIRQVLVTNILIVPFILNIMLIFKCYVPWRPSSYVSIIHLDLLDIILHNISPNKPFPKGMENLSFILNYWSHRFIWRYFTHDFVINVKYNLYWHLNKSYFLSIWKASWPETILVIMLLCVF